MRNSFLLFLILIVSSCSHQVDKKAYPEYYHQIRKAKSFAKQGEVHKALAEFDLASSTVPYTHTKYLDWAAFKALEVNDCDKALSYLKKAVEQGYEFSKWDYSAFTKCPGWTSEYEEDLFKALAASEEKINQELSRLIDSLYREDQKVRLSGASEEKREKVDSLNILQIRKIIEEHGFPDERLVGSRSANNAFIVMLHFDADKGNKIMEPILKDALYAGKISPENYAWIVDRRLNWSEEKKEPMYYQMPTKSFFELREDQKVLIDKKRHEIGLKPLNEINATLNPDGSIEVVSEE